MPTALIVEDEPEANRLLAMLVQLRGYSTDSAFTGGEALEKIRENPPDIIFLDLMLPDMNGYDICKAVKTRKTTSLIPVVMVTARVAPENRHESYSVGADDYVPKPYTPDQIFQAMSDVVAFRRDLDHCRTEGEIRFETRNDDALRQLVQLRSLLLARTPLDIDIIVRIAESLKEIAAAAQKWGRDRRLDCVAALVYQLQADRVCFTIRDFNGWLKEVRLSDEQRWPKSFLAARFDEIAHGDAGERLSFCKYYPAGDVATHD